MISIRANSTRRRMPLEQRDARRSAAPASPTCSRAWSASDRAGGLVRHLISAVTDRGGSALVVAHEEERVRPLVDHTVTLVDGVLTGSQS